MPKSKSSSKGGGNALNVIQAQSIFHYPTGDQYDGFFEIKLKEKMISMNGIGTYTTAENDAYTAQWDHNQISPKFPAEIKFSDGSKYEGNIVNWCYSGLGQFQFPDNSVLQCKFVNNIPVEDLTLVDPNGVTWSGKAEKGFSWLVTGNHYFENLPTELVHVNRKFKKVKSKQDANV